VHVHDVREQPAGPALSRVPVGRVAAFGGGFRSYRTVSSVSSGMSRWALDPGDGVLLLREITVPVAGP
jgi:hypothetical protein